MYFQSGLHYFARILKLFEGSRRISRRKISRGGSFRDRLDDRGHEYSAESRFSAIATFVRFDRSTVTRAPHVTYALGLVRQCHVRGMFLAAGKLNRNIVMADFPFGLR